MADWKQITARIRRARTGKDPAGQLSNLFTKTRDAMVAFELARYFESTGNNDDAGKWYLTAAQRFRRSDWKTKAQESATRLGATVAAEVPAAVGAAKEDSEGEETAGGEEANGKADGEAKTAMPEAAVGEAEAEEKPARETPARPERGAGRTRGRRGGRDHRPVTRRGEHGGSATRDARPSSASSHSHAKRTEEQVEKEEEAAVETPMLPTRAERSAVSPSLRGRSGDPGLSSRLSQLEMNFRRLVACDPVNSEEASAAPAGPGVWVLMDSDQSSYYYVEACQTLRVAIPNLFRNGSVRRGDSIKGQLAEHLGISEAKVGKYLADHCVVRWLQMDEGATHFAHFLVAVLRPALNE
jgi:hypothetical protein